MPNVIYRYARSCVKRHARFQSNDAGLGLKHRDVLVPKPQPTTTSEDGATTLRMRQHGNRSLPLPPFIDPIAIEAKQRHKLPKKEAFEKEEMTDFQKELADNPFGIYHKNSIFDPLN